MESDTVAVAQTWRTTHGDMTDEEWELIADLVAPYWRPGSMGRPVKVDRRRVVNAIFYVVATGCQWRALPESYPNWNTVHRYHLAWSKDGTWERIVRATGCGGAPKRGTTRGTLRRHRRCPLGPCRGYGEQENKGI
jgi:putative transposase